MQFKVSDRRPKATIEIDGVEYKVFSPTLGQSDAYSDAVEKIKDDHKKIYFAMREYISQLGNIPRDKMNKIPDDMFFDLFKHITQPEKKS
jgi:hypothetical protein